VERLKVWVAVGLLAWAASGGAAVPWAVPPQPGPSFPELALENPSGEDYFIGRALQRRLTVLAFYRGSWCPYSVQMLKELRNLEPELSGKGFQILAVTPERPFLIREMLDGLDLPYVVVCDRGNAVAGAFGLAPLLSMEEARRYGQAAQLPAPLPGEPAPRVPRPSLVVLGEDGRLYARIAGLVEEVPFNGAELIRQCDQARTASRLAGENLP